MLGARRVRERARGVRDCNTAPIGAPPREQGDVGRVDELDGSEHHFQSTNVPCWERSVASVLEVAVGYVVGRGELQSSKG